MAKGKEQASTSGYGSDFRRQILWNKAQEFALEVLTLTRDLPHERTVDSIVRQLVRSSTSIAANVAEGYGRYSQPAYRNHLSTARGSTFETESWLDLQIRSGYLSPERGQGIIGRCIELQRMITSRMKLLSQGKTYAVREEPIPYERK